MSATRVKMVNKNTLGCEDKYGIIILILKMSEGIAVLIEPHLKEK